MKKTVKFKDNPVNLVGRRSINEGIIAPQFHAISLEMQDTKLSDFNGKIKVITSFPSLDTPVCDLQVKEFNKNIFQLSPDIVIIGISKDLPFAQRRFCDANSISNLKILSDYRYSSFGLNYGLLIKELNLLARTAIILDKNNVIRYIQIAEETTTSINFKDVLDNLKEVTNKPVIDSNVENLQCSDKNLSLLDRDSINNKLQKLAAWELFEEKKIKKEYKFKDFREAKYFVDIVSILADEQDHHPDFLLSYNKLILILTTHKFGGLTENDFIMAQLIDGLDN